MSALLLVVHDFYEVRQAIWSALTEADFRVLTNSDPLAAVDTINKYAPRAIITRPDFGAGRLSGDALARMAKLRRNTSVAVFVAQDAEEESKAGEGEVFRTPLNLTRFVATVHRRIFNPHEQEAKVTPISTRAAPLVQNPAWNQ